MFLPHCSAATMTRRQAIAEKRTAQTCRSSDYIALANPRIVATEYPGMKGMARSEWLSKIHRERLRYDASPKV